MFGRAKLLFILSALTACSTLPATAQTATRPTLSYSTFLSASGRTTINASVIDAKGYQYVMGYTEATDFPTTSGAYSRTPTKDSYSDTGYRTMFITKFNRTGTALVYSTFIANAQPAGIAVDSSGNAYVVATPNPPYSFSFPTTAGSWRPSCVSSTQCSFLLKLNSTGSGLVYSTSLIDKDCGVYFNAVALDSTDHAYVAGIGGPGCYTTDNAYKRMLTSGSNMMVMKLTANGSGVLYSTYLGGNTDTQNDWPRAIAVDSLNHAAITGSTSSTDFPTTAGAFQRTQQGGILDAFIAKLNGDGSKLLASTLLGGSGSESASGIAIDPDNQVYVAGTTDSKNFPVTSGAVQTSPDTTTCGYEEGVPEICNDAFAAKLPPDLSKLVYSTYLGGPNGNEASIHIGVDAVGHAYVAGSSNSSQVPLVKPTNTTGLMWLSVLNTRGSAFQFSTRYGPTATSTGNSITPVDIGVDRAGNAYVAGSVNGYVQTTPGAYQTNGGDSFAAKWDIPPCTLSSTNRTVTICTPANNTTVPSKMLVAAGATDSVNVSAMRIYIDGASVFTISAPHFNTYVTLTSGTHRMTITAWDSAGPFSKTIYVTAP